MEPRRACNAIAENHTCDMLTGRMQVPGHDGLAYLNRGIIDDVIKHEGVVVQGLPINHTKSPDRWKNVCACTSVHDTLLQFGITANIRLHAIPVSTTCMLGSCMPDHQDAYLRIRIFVAAQWRAGRTGPTLHACMQGSCGLLVAGQ